MEKKKETSASLLERQFKVHVNSSCTYIHEIDYKTVVRQKLYFLSPAASEGQIFERGGHGKQLWSRNL